MGSPYTLAKAAGGAAKGGYYTSVLAGIRLFCRLNGRINNMGPVTPPGIEVFAGHIFKRRVPFFLRRIPMIAFPVRAEETVK